MMCDYCCNNAVQTVNQFNFYVIIVVLQLLSVSAGASVQNVW